MSRWEWIAFGFRLLGAELLFLGGYDFAHEQCRAGSDLTMSWWGLVWAVIGLAVVLAHLRARRSR